MTVKLYNTTSPNNKVTKDITELSTVIADVPVSLDVQFPTLVVSGKYPECNYVYIPYLNRYYYAKPTLLSNNTTKLDCKTDVLMSSKDSLYNTTQYVARCETVENNELIDSLIPLKAEYRVICSKKQNNITHSSKQYIVGVI